MENVRIILDTHWKQNTIAQKAQRSGRVWTILRFPTVTLAVVEENGLVLIDI